MFRTRCISLLAFMFACSLTPSAFAQNFIVNGTFDTAVPSNGTGGSWTTSNIGGGGGGWAGSGGNPTGMFTLNENGLATNPRIEQLLSGLTVGLTYTVFGDYQIHVPLGNPANSFGVLLDTSVILQLGNPGLTWTPFSTNFVATNTTHLLALEAERNDSDHSYSIDNISVVVAAVPEPGTWAMIALAVSGASTLGWKLKKSRYRRRK